MNDDARRNLAVGILTIAGLTTALPPAALAEDKPARSIRPGAGTAKPVVRPNCLTAKEGVVRPNCLSAKEGVVRPNCLSAKRGVVRPNCLTAKAGVDPAQAATAKAVEEVRPPE